MSCYDWESGTIKLPNKQWKDFCNVIDKAVLDHRTNLKQYLEWCKEQASKSDKFLDELMFSNKSGFNVYIVDEINKVLVMQSDIENLIELPLDIVETKTNTKINIATGLATINLDHKHKVFKWSVCEDDHACEFARNHPIARAIFNKLEHIEWTDGTGGYIIGNDEYSSHDDAGYITSHYGPIGKERYDSKDD